jgi:hypothetical protein
VSASGLARASLVTMHVLCRSEEEAVRLVQNAVKPMVQAMGLDLAFEIESRVVPARMLPEPREAP